MFVILFCASSASAAPIRFSSDVLPVLASKCFTCHGPDAEHRKAGLRLDQREGLFAPLKSGNIAVVPGDTSKSALFHRITTADPEEVMPPTDATKPLSDEEKQTLIRWIEEGAPWTGHWAFEPLRADAPPMIEGDSWSRNPIDQFIRAAQVERGLTPSPEADRRTLIRRLSFDLLGLPPTQEEVDRFIGDTRPDAWERLVDAMLASPRYGERWARHWLDVAHYGDTHGYDKDKRRENAWPYRDYVIHALNGDKPYGRFIQEQIAGDALYPDDPQATVALGFLAAGPWDFVGHVELREGTIDKAITRNLDRDDIVSTVMASVASLTAGCARCHDHKFDPISQEDYYSLQAVFAGIDRAEREFDDDPAVHQERMRMAKERDRLLRTEERFKQQLKELTSPDLDALNESLKPLEARLKELVRKDSPTNGYHSAIETRADVTKWVQVDLGTSMPLEKVRLVPARPVDFTDTPGFGFPLRFKVEASEDSEFTSPMVIADYTGAEHGFRTDHAVELDGKGVTGRFVRVTATRLFKRLEDYVFALAELELYSGGANVASGKTVSALDSIDGGRWNAAYLVDGYDSHQRLEAPGVQRPEAASIAAIERAVATLKAERETITLGLLPESDRAAYEENQRALAEANAAWEALPEPRKVYAGTSRYRREGNFGPAETIRPIHLLIRGSEKTPGPEVGPGTVGCIEGLESRFTAADESERRAALAHWLTDERNPLPWRSIVNRVWHYHFGQGIVSTPNDFGRMGAPPTHPELLDWLASEFLRNGKSLKWLHRKIVTSATYRQASTSNPAFEPIDGSNQYLWRMNRRQLEAEALRDATLAASGKLDLTMGGPGVNFFVFEDDHSPRYKYAEFDPADPSGFRRSIYRFVVRSVPDPFMTNMDCADPSQSVPVRNQTLTAIQALSMLNNPVTVRHAAYFAERVAGEGATVAAQLGAAYRIALNRAPREAELAALVPYAEKNGMAAACRVVLNSNEFMFVD
jgi:cytochrome c553